MTASVAALVACGETGAPSQGGVTPEALVLPTATSAPVPSPEPVTQLPSPTPVPTTAPVLSPTATPTVQLSAVSIEPKEATLLPGQTDHFTASVLDQFGAEIDGAVLRWTVSVGGTVSSDGTLIAVTRAGRYENSVGLEVTYLDRTLTAHATVVVVPGPLSVLHLSPPSVELDIGDVLQFSAIGLDSYGNEIRDLETSWQALAGLVERDGRFFAGNTAATFAKGVSVTVQSGNITLRGDVSITVRPDSLDRIELVPSVASVDIAAPVLFQAKGFDRYGNEIQEFTPQWSTQAGGISPEGLFVAGTKAGTFPQGVLVQGAFKGTARTATAQVTIVPGPLASLTLTPSDLQMEPLDVAQLDAVGFDAFANRIDDLTLAWTVDASAGSIDPTGNFTAGTKAGEYPGAVAVLAQHGGASRQQSADVGISPGPIASAKILPGQMSLFTGDEVSLAVEASDQFGNPVSPISIGWLAGTGTIEKGPVGTAFRAGREPGAVSVIAQVSDGRATATGLVQLQVDQGYCETERVKSTWDVTWWSSDQFGGKGTKLGEIELPRATFDINWARGELFDGRADNIRLDATAEVLVRHTPVYFNVGADDGYRLLVDGKEVVSDWSPHAFRQGEVFMNLPQGLHQLEIQYYEWGGPARLRFVTDPDILQWEQVGECFGGYFSPPDDAVVLLSPEESREAVAERFGVQPSDVTPFNSGASDGFLVRSRGVIPSSRTMELINSCRG